MGALLPAVAARGITRRSIVRSLAIALADIVGRLHPSSAACSVSFFDCSLDRVFVRAPHLLSMCMHQTEYKPCVGTTVAWIPAETRGRATLRCFGPGFRRGQGEDGVHAGRSQPSRTVVADPRRSWSVGVGALNGIGPAFILLCIVALSDE